LDEVVLNSSPDSAVDADGRSTEASAPIAKGIGEMIPTETYVFDSWVQESAEAGVADFVVFDLRSVGLDAEPDEVVRDFVLDDLHFRQIVHAKADESVSRACGTDFVIRHFGVDGASSQETVLGRIEQLVVADLCVFSAKNEDVETRKVLDSETRDFDASNRFLDGPDLYVLRDKIPKGQARSGDTDACLAGRVIGVEASEVGAFVVHWDVWWYQSCAFLADESYVVRFDG
jgi:hypothetical protein